MYGIFIDINMRTSYDTGKFSYSTTGLVYDYKLAENHDSTIEENRGPN